MRDKDNGMVYHYCDLNAFLNIVKTKSLWLSDVKKSNDTIEGKYLAVMMLQTLRSRLDFGLDEDENYSETSIEEAIQYFSSYLNNQSSRIYIPKGYTLEDIEKINTELEEFENKKIVKKSAKMKTKLTGISEESFNWEEEELPALLGEEYFCDKFERPIYATCFSASRDLLSQWRGYAADGTGVAIGFRKKYLNEFKLFSTNRCDFIPIEYDSRKTWEYAYKCSENLLDAIERKNRYKQNLRKLYANVEISRIANEYMSYSPYYKQESFAEEDEYRLIFENEACNMEGMILTDNSSLEVVNSKIKNFRISDLKFRVSGNKICSYYELSFLPIANDIIGEIIIGPKSEVTTADVEFILSIYGFNPTNTKDLYDQRSIYIRKSNLTYRN